MVQDSDSAVWGLTVDVVDKDRNVGVLTLSMIQRFVCMRIRRNKGMVI